MRWTMLVLLTGVCTGLAGCATQRATISMSQANLASDDVDSEKVATVNQWAQAHGARVLWLNYPVRAHPRSSGGDGD